jgi:hypothetical protein
LTAAFVEGEDQPVPVRAQARERYVAELGLLPPQREGQIAGSGVLIEEPVNQRCELLGGPRETGMALRVDLQLVDRDADLVEDLLGKVVRGTIDDVGHQFLSCLSRTLFRASRISRRYS